MIHYTSIEQSKKLLELGLDPATGDATYHPFAAILLTVDKPKVVNESLIPGWSDGAMMDILTRGHDDCICIKRMVIPYGIRYRVTHQRLAHTAESDYITGALFKLLCWMLEKKHV